MLHQALGALAAFSVSHDDTKLDNFHVVGDKIMAADFESAAVVKKGWAMSFGRLTVPT